MKAESKFYRLLLVSPWSLLVFLVIPLLVILSVKFNIQLPFAGSTKPLLVNNICFALFVACRLLRYLAGMRKSVRYGAACCRQRKSVTLPSPVAEVRELLSNAGYSFKTDGGYGEKRDLGYLGTTSIYAGLFILLSVGSWDNLRQFSGVLLDGMGPATNLSNLKSYRFINKGPLAANPESLPRLQIIRQFLPDGTYPKGATEVVLTSEDGKTEKFTLIPGKPLNYGAFDISMAKLVFEPQIVIKYTGSGILFDGLVTPDPLVQKRGVYSFYGLFQGVILGGGVYYQPEKSMLMVVITRGNEKVVTDLAFQVDQQAVTGDYILSCAKMGQWSEIHVLHRRHKGLLVVGGIIAIIGLLLRIAIRPQRVWLEEAGEGSIIWSSGGEAVKVLRGDLRTDER
jgi:hypothetical protein